MVKNKIRSKPFPSIFYFLLASLLMVLIYTHKPLFTSNQNQYFLHGMAETGIGSLDKDWLANTKEPTPLFTALVKWTFLGLKNPVWFYIYFTVLMGIYLCSLLGILDEVFHIREDKTRFALTVTLILIIHSAALRFILGNLFGANWTFLFDGGVAGQRLLGTVLQPSAFGVLLVTSLFCFMKDRPFWAVAFAAASACIHPTYLLSAALLIIGYMLAILLEEKNVKKALLVGLIALVLVAPILFYIYSNFWSTENALEARQILVNIRIPHHTLTGYWLDLTVLVKLSVVVLALVLVRKQIRIAIPLAVTFMGVIVFSMYQIITQNLFLALIFPWRPSTLLVPVSSSILAAVFSGLVVKWIKKDHERFQPILRFLCLVILAVLSLAGIWGMSKDFKEKQNAQEIGLYQWVIENSSSNDRFLIPVNLETFRTGTLQPVYIDYFAIPYSDSDVIEWYHRVLSANKFYDTSSCAELVYLRDDEKFTYVVMEKEKVQPVCSRLTLVYEDDYFSVYRMR